ncbi:MAG: gliding motility-associated C-terminal domain-containing protein [Flavobacteriales bacterium]
MRKKLFFIMYFVFVIFCGKVNAQFSLKGDAFLNSSTNQTCITLTADEAFKAGGFWSNIPLDLNQSFEIATTINFGCDSDPDTGGDGMAFVIQNQSADAGINAFGGGTLGYAGITPSLAIQMDTYRENPIDFPFVNDPGGGVFNLPYYDHMALMLNGQVDHDTPEDIITVPFTPFYTDVEDCTTGNFHHITISWDASTNKLDVFYCSQDGNFNTISQTIDITNTVFSGNNIAYWGFTGATGGATNEQSVCIDYYSNSPIVQDTIVCLGIPLDLDFSYLDYFSFEWKDENGIVISNNPSISLSPSSNTNYELTLINTCSGSTFNRSFDVDVLSPSLQEINAQHQDVECFGQSTGQLAVDFIGALGSVQYSISGGVTQNTNLFTNLNANNYTISATDQNGCIDNLNIQISEEAELVLNVDNVVGVLCNTSATGSIEVTPSGGFGSYNIGWTDFNGINYTDEDLFNLNDGVYNYFLSDSYNCQNNGQVIVEQLNDLGINIITQADALCFEGFSGEIEVNSNGGSAPFDFDWTGPNSYIGTGNNITNIEQGDYILTLTDDQNCYKDFTFTIDQPNQVIAASNSIPASCFNSNNGSINIIHFGGTGTTSANLLDNTLSLISNNNLTNGLNAGTYYSFALDSQGCSSDTSTIIVSSPTQIQINLLQSQEPKCFGSNDGNIIIDVSGGTTPYSSFDWTGDNGYSSSSQNITQLLAGNYQITINDDNNCSRVEDFIIAQPDKITINEGTIGYVKCTGTNTGSIAVDIDGGTTPYQSFSWTGPNGFNSNNKDIDSLYQGNYFISMEDDNGCLSDSVFTVFEPDSILQFSYTTTRSCSIEKIGTAVIEISGGIPPYNVDWFGLDPDALAYGNNFVEISDLANCIVTDSIKINLFNNPTAKFNIDTLLRKNINYSLDNRSIASTEWLWTIDESYQLNMFYPIISFGDTGVHSIHLQATNIFGCSDTISKNIVVAEELVHYIPNTFSPNEDGVNDVFNVSIENFSRYRLIVFNRFGQIIFDSTDNENEGWDGKYNGQYVPIGTYVYRFEANDLFGKLIVENNKVNLIR